MQITFTFRHIEGTDALRDHTKEKLRKLEKYWLKPETVHVILSVTHADHLAEITLTDNGEQFVGHAGTSDMYASIDSVVNKLATQLRRRKDRKGHHKGQPSMADVAASNE